MSNKTIAIIGAMECEVELLHDLLKNSEKVQDNKFEIFKGKVGEHTVIIAKSGVGKSTHTHLWLDKFPDARMINDDKPAIRLIDGEYCACGTPFSGKNDESANIAAPIKAIVFLERSMKNSISRISPQSAIPLFLSQTIRASAASVMDMLLTVLDGVLKNVPIYKLKCNISEEAVMTSYLGIQNDLSNGEKQ